MRLSWERLALVVAVLYPAFPFVDWLVEAATGYAPRLQYQLVGVFIFAIVALALNLQVGYAGLLQLGIAAFFALGAFATGILTVEKYPFQLGFWGALLVAPLLAGLAGLALGGPTMRLRGDYLAIVTLGFGEVVRVVLLNLENITDGSRGLNPLPPPWLPEAVDRVLGAQAPFYTMYYLALAMLVLLLALFSAMENAPLGRALMAMREDELACSCMGVSPARIKLVAFAAGAAIAGLAGVLYATHLTTTAEPNTYDFNYSVMVLCAVIIGGLGSLRGAVLGAFVLLLFDNVLSPLATRLLQQVTTNESGNVLLTFSNWRWLIFGVTLVIMMRLRPEGLWPARRIAAELHDG